MIYADHNATTPMSKSHWEKLSELVLGTDGNPSSIHSLGRDTKNKVEEARESIAQSLGVQRKEIFFTSGATEANNWVVQSMGLKNKTSEKRMIYSKGEHASISQSFCCYPGYAVDLTAHGTVDEDMLLAHINEETSLVCLIHVNNETGAVNPIEDLAKKIKAKAPKAHVHIDGVQSFGKLPLHTWLKDSAVDTLSLSAHKLGGMKGIGCLYKKTSAALSPWMLGGTQELGLRAGTLGVPGILSFGLLAQENFSSTLSLAMKTGLDFRAGLASLPKVKINSPKEGIPTTTNFYIEGMSGDKIMLTLDWNGVAVSAGSACASGSPKPSATLKAMGVSPWGAENSIRVSFGHRTKDGDSASILKIISSLI